MFEELTLPQATHTQDIYELVGDILTKAIEDYAKKEYLPGDFFIELHSLSEILEVQSREREKNSRNYIVTKLLALHFRSISKNSELSNEKDYKPLTEEIFELIDREAILKNDSLDAIDNIFPLFSPLCISMCLGNACAIVFSRFTESVDREMVSYLKLKYDIPLKIEFRPSQALSYIHSFYLISVHKEINEIMQIFVALLREKLLPRRDGSYASFADKIFKFYDSISNSVNSKFSVSGSSDTPYIDDSISVEEQDKIFVEYVNYSTMSITSAMNEFILEISTNESRNNNFIHLVGKLKSIQFFLRQQIVNILTVGSTIYEEKSLIDSIKVALTALLKDENIALEIKDLISCFLPISIFSESEVENFWQSKISKSRDAYLEAFIRIVKLISKDLSKNQFEFNKELRFLVRQIDSPLKSFLLLGIVDYAHVLMHLGFKESKISEFSIMEYEAVLEMYLAIKDEEFYSGISEFVNYKIDDRKFSISK